MTAAPPMLFFWDGEAMRPRRPALADRHYVIGEDYLLAEIEERSEVSHRHEFAWLREAWLNLPEDLADEFATPEHFRKRLLIETGFYRETILDAGSHAAAIRAAALLRSDDEYAVVVVRGPMVVRRVAKSQSRRAMDKAEFQASKQAILEAAAAKIGVTPSDLANQREAA